MVPKLVPGWLLTVFFKPAGRLPRDVVPVMSFDCMVANLSEPDEGFVKAIAFLIAPDVEVIGYETAAALVPTNDERRN